jgi:hypothetical protein
MTRKYEQLNQRTSSMMEDVGTYQLEEERNGSYKNNKEYDVPLKYLRK